MLDRQIRDRLICDRGRDVYALIGRAGDLVCFPRASVSGRRARPDSSTTFGRRLLIELDILPFEARNGDSIRA